MNDVVADRGPDKPRLLSRARCGAPQRSIPCELGEKNGAEVRWPPDAPIQHEQMNRVGSSQAIPLGQPCEDLVKGLHARRPGLDDTLHAHVRETVAGPTVEDAEHDAGLYAAVSEANRLRAQCA